MCPAILPVPDAEDAADPAAGAARVLEAGPATADPGQDPGLGPIPDQSPAPPETRRPELILPQDLDPDPVPSPGPEATPLPPKAGPGLNPKANPNQQQKMEGRPRRHGNIDK